MTSTPPPGAERRYAAYSLNAGPTPDPDRDLEPLSRRLLQVASLLSVLLIAVVANYALRSDENPFNPIAKAAERTQRAEGARMIMEVAYSTAGSSSPRERSTKPGSTVATSSGGCGCDDDAGQR